MRALCGESQRTAPSTGHPEGARAITNATPQPAMRADSRGTNSEGSVTRVSFLISVNAERNASRSKGLHSICAASISPCRSQAATAPGSRSNLSDARYAAEALVCSTYCWRQADTEATPKKCRQASTISGLLLFDETQSNRTISLSGSSLSQATLAARSSYAVTRASAA